MTEYISMFIDLILHSDKYLGIFISQYGLWVYLLLFLIIFAETGLVVLPVLPGDSLLFVAGTLAALGNINIWILLIILCVAATIGNITNYFIGNFIGEKIVKLKLPFVKQEYFDKTRAFFKKHGGKSIIFARFLPLFRTFVPFVAGAGKMHKDKFILFSIIGCIAWVSLFLFGGYYFGNIPIIKENLILVIIGVFIISLIPAITDAIRNKFYKRKK